MNRVSAPHLCRRSFIAAAGLGATVAFLPRLLFAQKDGVVPTMIDGAAKAKIETRSFAGFAPTGYWRNVWNG